MRGHVVLSQTVLGKVLILIVVEGIRALHFGVDEIERDLLERRRLRVDGGGHCLLRCHFISREDIFGNFVKAEQ